MLDQLDEVHKVREILVEGCVISDREKRIGRAKQRLQIRLKRRVDQPATLRAFRW